MSSKEIAHIGSAHDRRLIELAARGKTPEEMSEATGLDPFECVDRLKYVLTSMDIWSATEMSKIILVQMQELLGDLRDAFDSDPDPRMATALASAMKNVSEHYMKMRDLAMREEEIIGKQQEKILRLMIENAYNPVRSWVEERFNATPQDLEDMDDVFVGALRRADSGTR